MNGKKAKKLRKFAKQMATTDADVEYKLTRKHLIELPNLPKPVMCGTVVMKETCTRALYKQLKRGM
jgi:hypothetical protein|nr:MAG TPA: hypothetical protein [Caudoviricetes sp.]